MSWFRKYVHMVKCNLHSIQSHQSNPFWSPNLPFAFKRLILIMLETIINVMFLISGFNLVFPGIIFKESKWSILTLHKAFLTLYLIIFYGLYTLISYALLMRLVYSAVKNRVGRPCSFIECFKIFLF